MNASYVVHSCEPGQAQMAVTLPDGSVVNALVDAVTVELVSGQHGTIALRFTGSECQAAKDLFTPGRSMTASFAGA